MAGRRAVQAASRSKSELLAQAGVAIRAPLTAMLGYVDLLHDAAESGDLSAAATAYVESLRRSGPHLLALFNDLVDLARVDAGRLSLTPARVDPGDIVVDVVSRLRDTAHERRVELRIETPEAPSRCAPIRTASRRSSRTWSSARSGARCRESSRIGVRQPAAQGRGRQCRDRDCGQRAGPVRQRGRAPVRTGCACWRLRASKPDATRLGLCLSQRLARLLGGSIRVLSDIGTGTTYTLCIRSLEDESSTTARRPALRTAEAAVAGAAGPPVIRPPAPVVQVTRSESEAPRQRILVVDDTPEVHELVDRHLRDFGVTIQHADSGPEALEMAIRAPPDLILLDYDMSAMDGLETIRRLRCDKKLESVPVIFVTSSADTAVEVQAFRNGAVDFLRKPFQPAVLRARVRAALQTRALRDLLEREALHDRLTGLPNRALIQGRIGDAVAMKRADPSRDYALLFLDFDRFKLLNDTLGHEAGDELLRQIAQRMRSITRSSDHVLPGAPVPITARLGGDEFVVLLEGLAASQDALKVADRLLERLSEEFEVRGTHVISTASIGIVLGDASYGSAIEVLRDADAAMYEAKAAGRGRCVVFDSTMRSRVADRVKLERDLRIALEHEELFLEYQPIICLKSGRLEGIEALLRWSHPQRGRVSPGDFVQLAEETGLIASIGEWALKRACLDFIALSRVMGDHAPRSVSVNVSRQQLGIHDFPSRVQAIIE